MNTDVTGWSTVKNWWLAHKDIMSLNHLYRTIAAGNLRTIRVGTKILVADNALDLLDKEANE